MTKPLHTVATAHVCDCCLMWLANADNSSCVDYWGHTTTHHPLALCTGLGGDWVPGDSGHFAMVDQTCPGCSGHVLTGGHLNSVHQLGR